MLANNYFNVIINKYKDSNNKNNNNEISKNECNDLLFNDNIIYLNEALIHIDDVFMNNNLDEDYLNNIGKLYSIAYIKLYIKIFAKIYRYNKDKIDIKEITELISSKNINTRNVIKIFFF